MKTSILVSALLLFVLSGPSGHAQTSPANPSDGIVGGATTDRASRSDLVGNVPPAPGVKQFEYGERDVLRLNAKLRYTTLIVLPKNEQILDFTCGDKEFWIVNGTQNFAYIKPARPKAQTNLNLITASGNVYSFVLSEVSGLPGVEPDLKVFVELKEDAMISAVSGAPRFVSASQIEDYRRQVELAKDESRESRKAAEQTMASEIDRYRSEYPVALRFTYHFERDRKPFSVTAIYHDDKFTYIQANAAETPTLYEVKDGKPNLISFEFRHGTYVVPKILDSGYLAIGKARMSFARQE
jgi:type IV secretory pathway VirB9-like protein